MKIPPSIACILGEAGAHWVPMKTKFIAPLVAGLLATVGNTLFAGENTGVAAVQAVPADFSDSIVRVSGSGGSPDPQEWLVLAYEGQVGDGPREFKVVGGEVDGNHASFKLGKMISDRSAIDISLLQVDSPQAFVIAQEQCAGAGKTLAVADYALTQEGAGAVPTWTITCRDQDGREIGTVKVSASDGTVFSKNIK